MDAPPEQDSPKHILNALITDCIEEIFRKISNLNDFLQAAQVCQKFQQSAKAIFSGKFQSKRSFDPEYQKGRFPHKQILIHNPDIGWGGVQRIDEVSFDEAEAFLRIFGSQLQYLHISQSTSVNQERDQKLFKLIANLAGKSLKQLEVWNFDIDFEQTQFLALEKLILHGAVVRNFNRYSQLTFLSMHRIGEEILGSWCIQRMPLLVEVEFKWIEELTDDMLAEFLSLNPQLEKLSLDKCNSLSVSMIRAICTYSRNLVDLLFLTTCKTFRSPELNLDMLGTLQKLKVCKLFWTNSAEAVINAFARGNVPIERLTITVANSPGENLMTINTLNSMSVRIFKASSILPENLLRTQPALESLSINLMRGTSSMSEIEKLLRYGKNLKYFSYNVYRLNGDLASYESLLKAVRNRVIVHIRSRTKVDLPKAILEENHEYLTINYPGI